MKTFIYTLSDPDTNEIRYVGKTNTVRKRLYAHIIECKTDRTTHKISWIKSLLSNNKKPNISILDEVENDEWEYWEQYWILQLRSWGFNLTNIATGGICGNDYKRNDDTKIKMRKSKLGTKLSQEHKDNISNSIKMLANENPLYNRGLGNSRIILDKDELYQKYIIENLSLNKCAKHFKCSKKLVFRNITEHNFKKNREDWEHQLSANPKKPVIQYDMMMNKIFEYDSLKDAVLRTGAHNISSCCLNKIKSSGGFIWKYK